MLRSWSGLDQRGRKSDELRKDRAACMCMQGITVPGQCHISVKFSTCCKVWPSQRTKHACIDVLEG